MESTTRVGTRLECRLCPLSDGPERQLLRCAAAGALYLHAHRPVGKNGRFRPRIITGSEGSPRGYRIAAKYSDEFNLSSSSPESAAAKQKDLDEACRAIGRDPKSLTRSTMAGALLGRDDAEVARRADELLASFGERAASGTAWLDARRNRWILGTPDQAREMVKRYADAGIERVMLQDFLPLDLEMIDLMAEELIGKA
jgi:alkanesulfonate monooxygenase SsuD/methylene tetrahydromethanopterin reductase-like flavin-dependent oxidoreductase (luciferase family)